MKHHIHKAFHSIFGKQRYKILGASVLLVVVAASWLSFAQSNFQGVGAANVNNMTNRWFSLHQTGVSTVSEIPFPGICNLTSNTESVEVQGGTQVNSTYALTPTAPNYNDDGFCSTGKVVRIKQNNHMLLKNISFVAGTYEMKVMARHRKQSTIGFDPTVGYTLALRPKTVSNINDQTQDQDFKTVTTGNPAEFTSPGNQATPSGYHFAFDRSYPAPFTINPGEETKYNIVIKGLGQTEYVDLGAFLIRQTSVITSGPTINSISKTVDKTNVFYSNTNNTVTYTLGVTMNSNASPSNMTTNVVLEDDLPLHFTPTSWPNACSTAPSSNPGRTKVTCNYQLGNGVTQNAAIIGTVDDPAGNPYVMNNQLDVGNIHTSAPAVNVFSATPTITDAPFHVTTCTGNLGLSIPANTTVPYGNFYDCNGSKYVAFKSTLNWNLPPSVTSQFTVSGVQISNPVNPNMQLIRAYVSNNGSLFTLTTSGSNSPYTISGFNTFSISGGVNSIRDLVTVYRVPNVGSNPVTYLHDVTMNSSVAGIQMPAVNGNAEVTVGPGASGPNTGTVSFEVDVLPNMTQYTGTFNVHDLQNIYNFTNLNYGNSQTVNASSNGTQYTFALGNIPGYTTVVGSSSVNVVSGGTAVAHFTIQQNSNGGNGQVTFRVKVAPSQNLYTGAGTFTVANTQNTFIQQNILSGYSTSIAAGTYTFNMSQFSDLAYSISTGTVTATVTTGGSTNVDFIITQTPQVTAQVVFTVLDVTSNQNGNPYTGNYTLTVQEAGASAINLPTNPHSINVPITNGNNTHTYTLTSFYDPNYTMVDAGPKVITVGSGQNYQVTFKVRQVAQGNVRVRIFDRSNNNAFYAPPQSNWAQILIDATNNQTVVNSDQMYQMAIGTHSVELKASSLPSNYMIYSSALVPLTINNTNINSVQLVDYYVQKKEIALTVRIYDDSTGSSVLYNGTSEFDLSDRGPNEFVTGGQETFALGTVPSPQSVRFVTTSLPSGYTLTGNALRTFTLQPGTSRTEDFHIYKGNSVGNIVVEVRKDTSTGLLYNGGGVSYDLQYVNGNSQIYNNRPLPTGGTETVSNNPFGYYIAQIHNIPTGYTAVIANPSGTLSASTPLVLTMVITQGVTACPIMSVVATADPVSTVTAPINWSNTQDIRFYISWAATSGTTSIPSMTLNASLPSQVDFVSIGSYSQSGTAPVFAQNGNTVIFTYTNVAQNSSGQLEIRARLRDPGSSATFLRPLEFTYAPIVQGCGRLVQADASHDVNVFVYKDITTSTGGVTEPIKLVRNYSDNGTFRDSLTLTEDKTVVEYQIQFENEGTEDQVVDVQDTIGAGGDLEGSNGGSLEYVTDSFEIDSIGDDADYTGSIQRDNLTVTIPEGTKVIITYRARLSAPNRDTSTFTNTVTLDDDNNLSDSAIVKWNAKDDVNPTDGDISIRKTVDRSFVRNNDQINYTVTVVNNSGDTENIHVTDSMNAGRGKITGSNGSTITYVNGSLEVRGANYTGDIDDRDGIRLRNVDDGETVTIRYKASVFNSSTATALITNMASTDDDEDEVTVSIAGSDNIVPPVVPPTPNSFISILKTANKDIVVPGEEVIYTVVVRNNGPATDVVVVDTMPLGLTYISADRLEEKNGNSVRFGLGTMLPGATSTVNYVTRVNSNVTVGTVLTNQAQAFYTGGVSNTSQDSVIVRGGVGTIPTGSVLGASTLVASGGVSLLVIFLVLGITYAVRHKVRKSRK